MGRCRYVVYCFFFYCLCKVVVVIIAPETLVSVSEIARQKMFLVQLKASSRLECIVTNAAGMEK